FECFTSSIICDASHLYLPQAKSFEQVYQAWLPRLTDCANSWFRRKQRGKTKGTPTFSPETALMVGGLRLDRRSRLPFPRARTRSQHEFPFHTRPEPSLPVRVAARLVAPQGAPHCLELRCCFWLRDVLRFGRRSGPEVVNQNMSASPGMWVLV